MFTLLAHIFKIMEFKTLNQVSQLSEIDQHSKSKTQVLFKHSTRCSVSSFAQRILKNELSALESDEFDVYYLDLIAFREVSNAIALRYGVEHESPQLLVIKDGKCIYNASHSDVSLENAQLI